MAFDPKLEGALFPFEYLQHQLVRREFSGFFLIFAVPIHEP